MNTSERALEDEEARLAAASLATGDPTGWFDHLYAAGAAGRVPLPWSRREPHPLLTQWAQRHDLAGEGKRAIVPGCGSAPTPNTSPGSDSPPPPSISPQPRSGSPGTATLALRSSTSPLTCCTYPGPGCSRSTW